MAAPLIESQRSAQTDNDARHETRFETCKGAMVAVLGDTEGPLAARIVDISGNGMCIETSRPLALRGTVKVESDDTLWLAEVCYSQKHPVTPGQYRVGLKVEHALYHTDDLARLAEIFQD